MREQMTHSAIDKNVPQLRFREFNSTWNRIKLRNFITALKSGISVNSENVQCQENEIGILKTSSINDGFFIPSQNKKIIERDIQRAKLNPQKDSIIISRMNTPQLVGQIGYVPNNYNNLFIPDRLWQTVTNDKVNVKWLSYLLITSKIKFAITSKATGTSGTMKNIAKPSFLSIPFHSPTLPEQQKIATFLSSVDAKLQQLSKKKSLLADYKKGVMQKIFSQELRFKDANGNNYPDWEEKKLGDLCEIKKGQQLNKDELIEDGIYPAINGGINPSGYTNECNTPKNTITISEGGNSCGFINFIQSDFWSGGHCYSLLELNDNILGKYLFQILKHVQPLIMRLRVGSGLPNIQKKDINNFKVKLPSFAEQKKIATFLSALDAKIETVTTQINNTQAFKKGLLQQMFV